MESTRIRNELEQMYQDINTYITTNIGNNPTLAQVNEVEQRCTNLVNLIESAGSTSLMPEINVNIQDHTIRVLGNININIFFRNPIFRQELNAAFPWVALHHERIRLILEYILDNNLLILPTQFRENHGLNARIFHRSVINPTVNIPVEYSRRDICTWTHTDIRSNASYANANYLIAIKRLLNVTSSYDRITTPAGLPQIRFKRQLMFFLTLDDPTYDTTNNRVNSALITEMNNILLDRLPHLDTDMDLDRYIDSYDNVNHIIHPKDNVIGNFRRHLQIPATHINEAYGHIHTPSQHTRMSTFGLDKIIHYNIASVLNVCAFIINHMLRNRFDGGRALLNIPDPLLNNIFVDNTACEISIGGTYASLLRHRNGGTFSGEIVLTNDNLRQQILACPLELQEIHPITRHDLIDPVTNLPSTFDIPIHRGGADINKLIKTETYKLYFLSNLLNLFIMMKSINEPVDIKAKGVVKHKKTKKRKHIKKKKNHRRSKRTNRYK
jgi:hypothetical protein